MKIYTLLVLTILEGAFKPYKLETNLKNHAKHYLNMFNLCSMFGSSTS